MKVSGVVYGGRFIPLADNPGTNPPADAAAAPAAPATPKAAIQVDPNGPKAPAAKPEQPGMVDRVVGAARRVLADGAETGRQMEAIRARVKEADNGGKALTAAERAQAKKYGFTPLS